MINYDRFKIRVWYKPTQIMYERAVWRFEADSPDLRWLFCKHGHGIASDPTYCFLAEDCVIMQCTGIKDKKGRLLYEGDIIKDKNGFNNELTEYRIMWEEDDGVYTAKSASGEYGTNAGLFHYAEYVGNVFEMARDKRCREEFPNEN
jgi:uncharacterized phage protein (TIGR01671 family)